MKNIIPLILSIFLISSTALAAAPVTLQDGNANAVGVSANPLVVTGGSGTNGNTFPTIVSPTSFIVYQPDTNDTYVCNAPVGSLTSSAVWQCYYVNINGTTTTITWANGSPSFVNIATSPSTLIYS